MKTQSAAMAEQQAAEFEGGALRRLERRDWVLWGVAVIFLLALTFAIHSFELITPHPGELFGIDQKIAVRSVAALVFLFIVFAIYRQWLFNRLRRQFTAQASLVSALETRAEIFHKLAILDPLTGLYNRRFALQHLAAELARAARHGHQLTIMMFDLNGFKLVNDRFGHAAGDLVLREFASALRRAVRNSDIAARIGGDEFLVILTECDSESWPRVLARIARPSARFRENTIEIQYATGWAEYACGESVDELMERADRQLYDDKRTGSAERRGQAAHEQLRQAQKLTAVGRLTSGIAHDINNLLTVIKGFTELALDGMEAARRPHLEEVRKAAERAIVLTGQLSSFNRKQAPEPKLIDLNKLVASSEMILRRVVGAQVALEFEAGAGNADVLVDGGQIQQLLMQLGAAFQESMARGGRLLMRTENFEIDSQFCARHAGAKPGHYVQLIFHEMREPAGASEPAVMGECNRFEAAHAGKGGIRFSEAYAIVKQNGGYFLAEAADGNQAKLSIFFACAAAGGGMGNVLRSASSIPEPRASRKSKHDAILVVESLDSLRQSISDFLELENHTVLCATCGEDALQLAADFSGSVALVIADLLLPGMSGIELVDCLRSQRPGMKVLYISGYDDAAMYQAWLQSDAHFLSAPFDSAELVQKLRRLLAEPEKTTANPGKSSVPSRVPIETGGLSPVNG